MKWDEVTVTLLAIVLLALATLVFLLLVTR
jgi:hypothetical protein